MTLFALVDCNNFYASCERVFNLKLENKPIVVLSNNDGCVIARSNEAKALSIPMGAPFFKIKDFLKANNVHVFSSNYELYGDMSSRVMTTLETLCPDLEIYSIDEAFLQLNSFQQFDINDYCLAMRKRVKMWTGIPVSVGIGPTKTLAKMANHLAKKKSINGVFNLSDQNVIAVELSTFPVNDIWGVGKRIAKKLLAMNIFTAQDLANADAKMIRKMFSVVMEKTVYELRGQSCLQLEETQPKQQIMSSRSFGKAVTLKSELEEAVAYHVTKAAIKLRKQTSRASGLYFFLHTNPFNPHKKQYANSISIRFPEHVNDTSIMLYYAMKCLNKLYRGGFDYHKLGIMLLDLVPDSVHQQDLLLHDTQERSQKKESLIKVVDKVNVKLGKNTLKFCVEGYDHQWCLRSNFRSPRVTTSKTEVLIAYCR
jgi:DNA polymerase V